MSVKAKVLVITGPTASGKSLLAEGLASRFPLELVCVDSAAVYKGMDIGTAKPTLTIRQQIPYHLIDIRDPAETYSAAEFRDDATQIITDVIAKDRIPCLVGGTMLYLRALKQGIADLPSADPVVREQILQQANAHGWSAMHKRLAVLDPKAASRIHTNDPQRLQRALEVYEITGRTLTEHHEAGALECPFDLVEVAVIPQREMLHGRIAERFHGMLEKGFVEEVRALFERGDLNSELPSMKAVGYRQIWSFLVNELSYEEMVERAIVATRRLAKHQYTWLKAWQGLHVIVRPESTEALKIPQVSTILMEGSEPEGND